MSTAITATGLGKRYRQRWALRECTLEIPEGRVAGLVGPNGAGKTTLLHLATGLLEPSTGTVSVFGLNPRVDAQALPVIGFVGQEVPLYRSFTVADMLSFGRHLNPSWDDQLARCDAFRYSNPGFYPHRQHRVGRRDLEPVVGRLYEARRVRDHESEDAVSAVACCLDRQRRRSGADVGHCGLPSTEPAAPGALGDGPSAGDRLPKAVHHRRT